MRIPKHQHHRRIRPIPLTLVAVATLGFAAGVAAWSQAPAQWNEGVTLVADEDALTLEKVTNSTATPAAPGPYIAVGDPVEWTFTVTNGGQFDVTLITVTDDTLADAEIDCGAGTNTIPTLAPDSSASCTATGVSEAGQHTNTATAEGRTATETTTTSSSTGYYFGSDPSLTIEKTTNTANPATPPGPLVAVGDPVVWAYVVENTGNVALTGVTVADDQGVTVTCPATTLAVGASMTCTANGTAEAGQYTNTGTATGTGPPTTDVDGNVTPGEPVGGGDPSFYNGVESAVTILKKVNGEDANSPPGPAVAVGSTVEWTYEVANTGTGALTAVEVVDDQGVTVTCPGTTLAAGASMTCTASGVAEAGQNTNTGTATGTGPETTNETGGTLPGQEVTDTDTATYHGVESLVIVVKMVNGEDANTPPGPAVAVGSTVEWTYEVTNAGSDELTDVEVVDDQGVTVTCPGTTLAAGASMTCTASGMAEAGQNTNTGTVTGTGPETTDETGATVPGEEVTDSDTATYHGVESAVTILKKVNGEDANTPPVLPSRWVRRWSGPTRPPTPATMSSPTSRSSMTRA